MSVVWPVLYIALMAFLPLAYSTVRSARGGKLRDRVFLKTVVKDYLRTVPAVALVSIPLGAFPQLARGYVVALHAVFMWLVVMEIGHIYLFGARMGLNTFYSLFVTNARETVEYIRNNQTKAQWALILSIYILPFAALLRVRPVVFEPPLTRGVFLAACALLALPFLRNLMKRVEKQKAGYVLNPFVSVFYHYFLYRRRYGALKRQIAEHAAPRFEGFSSEVPNDVRETYVVCIGESSNSMHHSYAGYPRHTNEFTDALGDVLDIAGVEAQYAQTLPSLEKTITFATDSEPEKLFQRGSIVDYFKDAGFKVFWLSNQYALEDTAITAMAGHADTVKCLNFSAMKGFETAGYDGTLLPEFARVLEDPAPKKAVFLHMIGSHSAYVNRYPAEFRFFQGVPPGKDGLSAAAMDLVNSYDDSIRYTDWVIAELVKKLRERGGEDAEFLLYFSDHGEDCYDTTSVKMLGHSQLANAPMRAVPLQIWLSPSLKALRPGLVARTAAPKRGYRLEDLIHTVIDLAGLSNPDFDPSKSVYGGNP